MRWSFLWRKKEQPALPPVDTGDWSLRANGETYHDRHEESIILIGRLKTSSASVTGIAGQRGAGKSSLALRVLSEADKRGAFTLLIHSPTGYEPREFLVSVFQRICEEVVFRINHKFGEADSLSERGKVEERRLKGTLAATFLGLTLVTVASMGYGTQYYLARHIASVKVEIQARIERLDREEKALQGEIDRLRNQKSRTEREEAVLIRNTREMAFVQDEKFRFSRETFYYDQSGILFSFVVAGLMVLLYSVTFIAFRFIRHVRRQLRWARKYPRETGLRKLATDLLEHLQYQKTLTASGEASVSVLQATSKLVRGKSLTDWPLSLPGLTSQLALFLEQVGEVYSQSVVICLDELDKIENPDELDQLLRGIKGILGQRNSHFLLTVSEDALARFTTRGRMDRGMLESAFENIILLDRVGPSGAECILDVMYPPEDRRKNSDTPPHVSTLLIWLFGNGIPREIKRSALSCMESGLMPKRAASEEIWALLFRARLEATKSWAGRVARDDGTSYLFLTRLQAMDRTLGTDRLSAERARTWSREFVGEWKEYYTQSFGRLLDSIAPNPQETAHYLPTATGLDYSFARAVLDLLVGASGLSFALNASDVTGTADRAQRLLTIFEFMPSNLPFASALCWDYFKALGLLN